MDNPMKILEWDELEDGKAYLMHEIDSGKTYTCRYTKSVWAHITPEGQRTQYAATFKDGFVFAEIELPSRSDWALAILRKDAC